MRNRLQKKANDSVRVSDVAEFVGYSTATVSRALNNQTGVSREVREKVLTASKTLGYLPNNAARALRQKKTRIIGAVIPTLNHSIYARMVEGLQKRLALDGLALLHATSEYNLETEYRQSTMLLERGVEGLVLVGNEHHPNLKNILASRQIPYVNTYVYSSDNEAPCVGFDNFEAAYAITDFLVQLGHSHFAMIAGIRAGNDRVEQRIAGVRARLTRSDMLLPDDSIAESPYTIDGGVVAMKALNRSTRETTAIICGSDILAFGALSACGELGIQVPQDLSIVGFDNLEFSAHLSPPLTTVEVPAAEMGATAAEHLLNQIESSKFQSRIELETKIILRKTTAPPRS